MESSCAVGLDSFQDCSDQFQGLLAEVELCLKVVKKLLAAFLDLDNG
jgi:hypothetical protein